MYPPPHMVAPPPRKDHTLVIVLGVVGGILVVATVAIMLAASPAAAHSVIPDGVTTEWSTRTPSVSNQGLIARTPAGTGEYVFDDAPNDERTDLGVAPDGDLRRVQVTADGDSVSFLIVPRASDPATPQIQISVDVDRLPGSGQIFLAGFADTTVAEAARWELLVQTTFHDAASSGARVLDAGFVTLPVAAIAVRDGTTGAIEIDVPLGAFGALVPPALRFTVTSYRSQASGDAVDVGGPTVSNALDAVGDCANPQQPASLGPMYPNAWDCDLSDGDVDYYFDVWLEAGSHEVYAPLVVSHFLTDAATGTSTEYVAVRNVSPVSLLLDGFKLGDEETVDPTGTAANFEAMGLFPTGRTLTAGSTFIVAQNGVTYAARFGEPPDAEFGGLSPADDMTIYTGWFANGGTGVNWALANTGDQILVLDPSNTILDLVVYGPTAFMGVTPEPTLPGDDEVLMRVPFAQDTDDCAVDFVLMGVACAAEPDCPASACSSCVASVCAPEAAGTACLDFEPCNGDETCNGLGECVDNADPVCDDAEACTLDVCSPGSGCQFLPLAAGTSCDDDSDPCNGGAVCDADGTCTPVAPPDTCFVDAGPTDAAVVDAAVVDAAVVDAAVVDAAVADAAVVDAALVDAAQPETDGAPATVDAAARPDAAELLPPDDSGCGCRVGAPSAPGGWFLLLIGLGLALIFVRRR